MIDALPQSITEPADLAYVKTHFVELPRLAHAAGQTVEDVYREIALGLRPRPAYVLDGAAFVGEHYFEDVYGHADFCKRYLSECGRQGLARNSTDALDAWESFLSGIFAVCLYRATPENIARKESLIARIDDLVREPGPGDSAWVASLAAAVDDLDALERPFSPIFDRRRFGRPPSRDRYVNDVRQRFLQRQGT
ncbi:MAG TPA: DUF6058 family natural product biosynthesis protein [Candidatus Acidoferrales bacterium]|nr:DUF6058 family natural product biosynthesis protein [Candidatus Acidoferrales bacterium]